MGDLSAREDIVARHYDEEIFDYEVNRLLVHQPVEFAITTRYLQRYVPSHAVVADVGVGAGHYAELLARRRCSVRLIDISERLLEAATAHLHAAGLSDYIIDATQASAMRMAHLDTASCDAVLLLGPLYHLPEMAERERAVSEAARVLKAGGVLFAAGINRIAYLRDSFRESSQRGGELRSFHAQFMRDGNLDPEHAPPISYAHLSTSEEFRSLFADSFKQAAFVGVESFTSIWGDLPAAATEAWLDLVEQTGATSDGLGVSDHFLFIGYKR